MASPDTHGLSEHLEIAAARAIMKLPPRVKRRIAGEPIRADGLELDLDTQVLLKLIERNPRPPLSTRTPAQAREDLRRSVRVVTGPSIAVRAIEETSIKGAGGPLRARLYTPDAGAPHAEQGALVVYYHGGGWVAGDLDTHDQPCRLLANASGARVLSVEYRLAPEHRFPAGVEDAICAFADAVAHAQQLGVDPARIAVAGDSAGGHLAAVVAQHCAASSGPAPAFQLLIYPATDLFAVAPSRVTFAEGFVLTKENMDWYEEQFLGRDSDRRDPRASPLLAEDLSGVAPALVVSGGFDPLRDEGEAYARRLDDAGVRVICRRYPGYVHGFIHALTIGAGPRDALAEIGGVLRAALAA
jgi:acetyl esterase